MQSMKGVSNIAAFWNLLDVISIPLISYTRVGIPLKLSVSVYAEFII